jgi:hypothetical protein
MGALIMTKGTKRLAAHYNDEFDTWLTWYQDPARINVFNRNNADIDIWNDVIQNQTLTDARPNGHTERGDNLTLLPKDSPQHQNLHQRWRYFLQLVIGQPRQNLLADHLFAALQSNISYICFDVVLGNASDVLLAADVDDGQPIARITIVTTGHLRVTPHTPGGNDPPPLD